MPPDAVSPLRSAMFFWAHASNLDVSTSTRTGIDLLRMLKVCRTAGSSTTVARSSCSFLVASFDCLKKPH